MTTDNDMFAPPDAEDAFEDRTNDDSSALGQRRNCYRRECGIRAVGLVVTTVGISMGIVLAFLLFVFAVYAAPGGWPAIVMLIFFAATASSLTAGIGLLRLSHAARVLYTVIACIFIALVFYGMSQAGSAMGSAVFWNLVMIALAIGFMVHLWTEPANEVFSRAYRRKVIPATRNRYSPRAAWWGWVLAIILVILNLMAYFG